MSKYPYQDPTLSIEERVKDLMSRMSLEEKVRQLDLWHSMDAKMIDTKTLQWIPEKLDTLIGELGIGAMQHPQRNPENNTRMCNEMQKYMLEKTRWGIPVLFYTETLHGHISYGVTIFPQSIGLASSFDDDLMKEVAKVIGLETGVSGAHLTAAPDLDLAQEPRWGRVEETYGEDPYLVGRMGLAYIKGMQGDDYHIDRDHIGCTVKHYLAHGNPQGGLNIAPVPCGERMIRELYLKPFKKCIAEGKPPCVMPAYSEIDGVPVHQNKFALHTLLREEMGFDGFVITDWEGMDFLKTLHATAETWEEAGKLALMAGCDMESPRIKCFNEQFIEMVRTGEIPMFYIDRALARVLGVKFRLGLFENPFLDEERPLSVINCQEHKDLALRAAQESIILLKNENDTLPLSKDVGTIAVIGPNADVAQLGGYCVGKDWAVTPLQGIQNRAGANTKVLYAEGCDLVAQDDSQISKAVEIAKKADVAVVVVGGASMIRAGVGWGDPNEKVLCTCGEGFDRSEIDLPGKQQQLVEAIVATGTPVVVVLNNGRPQTIPWIAENASAILEMWYAGDEGGNALADVLFGNVNPSGKLPISFPVMLGQTPVFYNHKPSARGRLYKVPGSLENPGRDYVFASPNAQWDFGFGLSYTTFAYSNLRVTPETAGVDGTFTVSVKVKNTGKREGKEVVQLYVRDMVSSVTTPVKALKGFEKINLKPGEEKEVSFTLGFEELSLINIDMKQVVEPGKFTAYIADLEQEFFVK